MKTVYDAKTGKPRKLHLINVREQLDAGLISLKPLERTIPEPEKVQKISAVKPARKTRKKE